VEYSLFFNKEKDPFLMGYLCEGSADGKSGGFNINGEISNRRVLEVTGHIPSWFETSRQKENILECPE
jgi:hypothetical protein